MLIAKCCYKHRAERIAAREKLAAERSPPRRREGRGDGWDPERFQIMHMGYDVGMRKGVSEVPRLSFALV